MQTNAEEEAHEPFVCARHSPIERIGMSDGYVENCIFANAQRIRETDFRVSNFEEQPARKTKKQKGYEWWDNTNGEKLTNNNKDRKDEF